MPKLQLVSSRLIKIFVVIVVVFVLWYFTLQQIQNAIATNALLDIIAPTALLVIFVPFLTLSGIAFGARNFFIGSVILSSFYLLFFPIDIFALVAVVFLIFGFWRAYKRTQFGLHNNIKFDASHVIKRVSSIFFLVLLLVVSFNIYASVAEDLRADPSGFFTRLSQMVTKGVLPIVERQFEDFQPDVSLDQFIISGLTDSLPGFRDLPSSERLEQVSLNRSSILEQLGIAATGNEPLSDITQRAVETKVTELVQPKFTWLVPIVYAMAIFSILRILMIFTVWIIQIWGSLLFLLLRKSGFLIVTETEILAEHVEI